MGWVADLTVADDGVMADLYLDDGTARNPLGRGQPRLTFETLQAAYSQPTFRNPLWDHKIRKILRRPI